MPGNHGFRPGSAWRDDSPPISITADQNHGQHLACLRHPRLPCLDHGRHAVRLSGRLVPVKGNGSRRPPLFDLAEASAILVACLSRHCRLASSIGRLPPHGCRYGWYSSASPLWRWPPLPSPSIAPRPSARFSNGLSPTSGPMRRRPACRARPSTRRLTVSRWTGTCPSWCPPAPRHRTRSRLRRNSAVLPPISTREISTPRSLSAASNWRNGRRPWRRWSSASACRAKSLSPSGRGSPASAALRSPIRRSAPWRRVPSWGGARRPSAPS